MPGSLEARMVHERLGDCAPPSSSCEYGVQSAGFDFLHGRWAVTHRKLRERLAGCTDWFDFPGTLEVGSILAGAGNFDRNLLFDPAGTYEASSLRLFDSCRGLWSVYWVDGRAPALEPPVVGLFDGRKGTFYNEETLHGRPVRVRTTYEPLTATTAEWAQAFSADEGATWEVNWVMEFARVPA